MKTSFADYCDSAAAREQIAANVEKWTEMLCEALKKNYIDYCIKMFGHCDRRDQVSFVIETGRKYHEIIHVEDNGSNRLGPSRSVHAFVDKKTGEVYKAASFKAPAKIVRFDLRLIEQREWLLEHADWAGGYLYKK